VEKSARPAVTAPPAPARADSGPGGGLTPSAGRKYRPEITAAVRDLVADVPGLTEGKMFGLPAFFVAGKLFACVYGEGVGLKLPAERVATLLGTPGVDQFRPYGKPSMRQWIHVTRTAPEQYAGDLELLLESARFVAESATRETRNPRPIPRRRRPSSRRPTRPAGPAS